MSEGRRRRRKREVNGVGRGGKEQTRDGQKERERLDVLRYSDMKMAEDWLRLVRHYWTAGQGSARP